MKKITSFCLAVIVLASVLPLSTKAADTYPSERDKLISLACQTFPEYSSKILAENDNITYMQPYSLQTPQVSHEETRWISETEGITYTEFSDGLVYLSSYYLEPTYSHQTSVSDNGTTTVITCTIGMTSNYNGDFYAQIKNVKYAIVNASPDYFISAGTMGNCYEVKEPLSTYIVNPYESTNLPAEARCYVNIYNEDGTDSRIFDLKMYVFNGEFYTSPALLYSIA